MSSICFCWTTIVELSPLSYREIQGDTFKKPFIPTLEYIKERSGSARRPEKIWDHIHRGGYDISLSCAGQDRNKKTGNRSGNMHVP